MILQGRQKPSVNVDLAIYSHVVDVSGQRMSVSLILYWISVLLLVFVDPVNIFQAAMRLFIDKVYGLLTSVFT